MTVADDSRSVWPRGRLAAANNMARTVRTPVFWLSAVLLSLAFVFGGASRGNPLSTMAIELVGVTLLVATVWSRVSAGDGRIDRLATALLGIIFVIPALQLVPLPPEVWTTLPGRREVVETLRIAGIEPGWAPLSLDPEATFRALLWLVPAGALFLAVSGLDTPARFWLAGIILALCIASLILGGLQITDRDGGLFASPAGGRTDLPIGFFANRNHQGVAMAAALPFAAAFAAIWGSASSRRTRAANIVFGSLVALLIVGVLVTRSRAALTLVGPALIASVGIFWAASGAGHLRWRMASVIVVATAIFALAAQFATGGEFDRFETLAEGDGRFDMWPSIITASADGAPVGAGLGAFASFYRAWEPLDLMTSNFINHAHNDYLELWLETGWFALVTVVAVLSWLARASLQAWLAPTTQASVLARAGAVTILSLLTHSAGDYPLRTQALACVLAVAAACLRLSSAPHILRKAGRERDEV